MFCRFAGVHLVMKRRGRLTALPAEAIGTELDVDHKGPRLSLGCHCLGRTGL